MRGSKGYDLGHTVHPPDPSWWERFWTRRVRRRVAVTVLYGLAAALVTVASGVSRSLLVGYLNGGALFCCLAGLRIAVRRRP